MRRKPFLDPRRLAPDRLDDGRLLTARRGPRRDVGRVDAPQLGRDAGQHPHGRGEHDDEHGQRQRRLRRDAAAVRPLTSAAHVTPPGPEQLIVAAGHGAATAAAVHRDLVGGLADLRDAVQ